MIKYSNLHGYVMCSTSSSVDETQLQNCNYIPVMLGNIFGTVMESNRDSLYIQNC